MMRDAKNGVPLLLLTDYVSGRRMIFLSIACAQTYAHLFDKSR